MILGDAADHRKQFITPRISQMGMSMHGAKDNVKQCPMRGSRHAISLIQVYISFLNANHYRIEIRRSAALSPVVSDLLG